MKRRLKLKKGFKITIFLIIVLSLGSIIGINKYKEYLYHQTYEYKLLEHGYSMDDIKIIQSNWNQNEEIEFYLNNPVNNNYIKLMQEKYYLKKNYQKYIEYMKDNPKLDLSTIVRNINIHYDEEYYTTDFKTDSSLEELMLVNKYYSLDSDYEPTDLVSISSKYAWGEPGSKKVKSNVLDAFIEMWEEAKEDGYYLMINSAYRPYKDQEIIYNNYKAKQGQKYADSIAAHPGHSEHQTGLCLDIFSKTNSNKQTFGDSEAAAWLKNNSYKYGFILRYPEDPNINVTGFTYEAWHFRYVGKEAAKYIYENNIIFEEYYAYFIEK